MSSGNPWWFLEKYNRDFFTKVPEKSFKKILEILSENIPDVDAGEIDRIFVGAVLRENASEIF